MASFLLCQSEKLEKEEHEKESRKGYSGERSECGVNYILKQNEQ